LDCRLSARKRQMEGALSRGQKNYRTQVRMFRPTTRLIKIQCPRLDN